MRVPAKPLWTDTGLLVQPGQTLGFLASGIWTDWVIQTGPDGFRKPWLKPFERRRRVPDANWFALCGALDEDLATAFIIGSALTRTFQTGGRLSVFANDVPSAYWNNKGAITLDIA